MAEKKKKRKVFRDAENGEFTSKEDAAARPSMTISQTVDVGSRPPKIDADCDSELETIGHQEAVRLGIAEDEQGEK